MQRISDYEIINAIRHKLAILTQPRHFADEMKQKTFRIWDSDGNPKDIRASTIEFKKTKEGLLVTIDKNKKIKGVTALIEVSEPVAINRPPPVDED